MSDAVEAFEAIRGFSNVKRDTWLKFVQEARSTRSNTAIGQDGEERRSEAIERQRARLDIRANCFRLRVGKQWNDLPEEVKSAKSVYAFKNAYDAWTNKPTNNQRRD